MEQIINSILDTDLYKITMHNAVIKKFPNVKVKYKFINRDNRSFPDNFAVELRKQVKLMENLFLSKEEKEFLKSKCYFLDSIYLDFLENYRFDASEIGIIQNGNELDISIDGYWHRSILWEVPLMSIISELYFKMTEQNATIRKNREQINKDKARIFANNGMSVADFGSRRRYSYEIQNEVIQDFKSFFPKFLIGTSNVHFAHLHNLTPIGTHAHEWFMFHGAKYGYKYANFLSLENWVDVYRGDLGIALSDTYTSNAFFKSFDKKFSKLFDGVRHDSGDPFEFTEKTIDHYKKMNIDPMSKTIIFSDGLNAEVALKLQIFCSNKIKCSFGIGTNLTNDVGVKPLNIVIKMSEINLNNEWIPTIKLSDSEGKYTGDINEIEICKHQLKI